MPSDEQNQEALRTRRGIAQARWSLFVIFGIGAVGVVAAIAFVIKSLPQGALQKLDGPVEAPSTYGRKRNATPRHCVKFGDRCEHSPGKLGTCIGRENCTDGNCLFCQSQH